MSAAPTPRTLLQVRPQRNFYPHCSATIRMDFRIASWRNAPEDTIIASFILLPRRRTVGTGKAGRGAGRVAQRPAFPVPEAGAVMAQSVCRSGVA